MQSLLPTRSRALLAAACLLAAGCASGPFVDQRPFPYTEFTADGPLESVRPVDVLVAPVHDQSGVGLLPEGVLRESLMAGLVDRLYSPLSEEWSGRTVDAGFDAASTGAEAILQVVVTRWDTKLLDSHSAILAEAEARLFEAESATRTVLWAVDVGRRLEVTTRMRERLPASEVQARMADQLAGEILALLPERDPLAD